MLTMSKIIDISGDEPIEYRGEVPERSVVIPGTIPKTFKVAPTMYHVL